MNDPIPELALERLLLAIEHELLAASDHDVEVAARELGIKPEMKGSIALVGIIHFAWPRAASQLRATCGPEAPATRRGAKGDASTPG